MDKLDQIINITGIKSARKKYAHYMSGSWPNHGFNLEEHAVALELVYTNLDVLEKLKAVEAEEYKKLGGK